MFLFLFCLSSQWHRRTYKEPDRIQNLQSCFCIILKFSTNVRRTRRKMGSYYAIFFILFCGIADKAIGKKLTIDQGNTVVTPDNGILTTEVPIKRVQPITYFKGFDTGTLYYTGKITDVKTPVYEFGWEAEFDVCEDLDDGTWEDATGQIIRKTWFPDGACPVKAGNYTISNPTGPIEVNLREKVVQSIYAIEVQVGHSASEIVFSTMFAFTT
ncbi:uncharacterized protein [Venturia canescens]|uniref:uncharacterized protein isoform X2 n=1 Tax=Venturia canescens TaxID=32260 RepID=UPI001C9D4D2E|nr:uncharacterized protein LOC122417607 isoform X2 [Venturia canescens]